MCHGATVCFDGGVRGDSGRLILRGGVDGAGDRGVNALGSAAGVGG